MVQVLELLVEKMGKETVEAVISVVGMVTEMGAGGEEEEALAAMLDSVAMVAERQEANFRQFPWSLFG